MLTRVVMVGAVAAAGFTVMSPHALATYYSYGTLTAYEGSTRVAQGKGTHGVDFGTDAIGGHIGARDLRPGGSPAYGVIVYAYRQPSYAGPFNVRGRNNQSSTMIDTVKYRDLDINYTMAETYSKACQHDAWGPDVCASSPLRNHKW